jgi:hypothetical protein
VTYYSNLSLILAYIYQHHDLTDDINIFISQGSMWKTSKIENDLSKGLFSFFLFSWIEEQTTDQYVDVE